MPMSWLSPSGSAVAESHHHGEGLQPKLPPGRQAALPSPSPAASGTWQTAVGRTDREQQCGHQPRLPASPRHSVPWQTSAGQRGGLREDGASQQLGEVVALVSRASCILLLQPTGSPSPVLWTQTQAELCVSSLLQHSSSCLSPLKSQGSKSTPICISEMRKGAAGTAGVAPTCLGGGRLKVLLTKLCSQSKLHLLPWLQLTAKAAQHLQGAWILLRRAARWEGLCEPDNRCCLAPLPGGAAWGTQVPVPGAPGKGGGMCPEARLASLSLRAPNTAPPARTSPGSTE